MKLKIFNSSDIAFFFIQRAGDKVERLAKEQNEKVLFFMLEVECFFFLTKYLEGTGDHVVGRSTALGNHA